jgi:hypothetical protein
MSARAWAIRPEKLPHMAESALAINALESARRWMWAGTRIGRVKAGCSSLAHQLGLPRNRPRIFPH